MSDVKEIHHYHDPTAAHVPPILLAENWNGEQDLSGWLMSEKLDGVRAWWDGKNFISRQGHIYMAPAWFKARIPSMTLDGELFIERNAFQKTISIVQSQDAGRKWEDICYMVFDAPKFSGDFDARIVEVYKAIRADKPKYADSLTHIQCKSNKHLRKELTRVEKLGGEGLMLRDPKSMYEAGRSYTLLKVTVPTATN